MPSPPTFFTHSIIQPWLSPSPLPNCAPGYHHVPRGSLQETSQCLLASISFPQSSHPSAGSTCSMAYSCLKISGNIFLGVLLLQTPPASSWASFLSIAHWALRFLISKKKRFLISCLLPHLGQAPSHLRTFGYALPCAKDILTSTFHVVRALWIEAGFNITSSSRHYFLYQSSPEKRTSKTLER